ncbi:hypothetical protein OGY18_05440 [Citrobacter sp. Cpo142]|jgi:hypothetical protein|uniref:hypothetical protein n=1 Tax=Citrobacter TaxID=544 RepID=UPI002575132F|nr:hypothetical protein [Citrobacter sp. Cpo142]MDM2776600.1 hypothetical protein [Citrobacter sp. Cpo142]
MNALLICPEFFDYATHMQDAIERQGLQCFRIDEKPSNISFSKIIIRLLGRKKIVQKFLLKSLQNKVNTLNIDSFDYIVIIKAECVSNEFMIWLKSKYIKSKFLFYAWDSIRNYPHVEGLLHHFDQCFSFDRNDSLNYERLEHLPLFYSPHYKKSTETPKVGRISFIGSYHSDRFDVLNKIQEKYSDIYDLNFNIYFPSVIIFSSFLMKNYRSLSSFKNFRLTLKPISGEDIVKVYNNSSAVVDIHHPHQNGLTMRVIELLPLRRKIITTNESVKDYPFYHKNNICIIDRDDPVIDDEFITGKYVQTDELFISLYSIDSWAKKLLSI